MAGGGYVRHGGHSHVPRASEKVERAASIVSRELTFIFVILFLSLCWYVKLCICGFLCPCSFGSHKHVSLWNFLVLCVVLVENGTIWGVSTQTYLCINEQFLKEGGFLVPLNAEYTSIGKEMCQ